MGLNCAMLPILVEPLAVDHQAPNHRLLPGGAAESAGSGRRHRRRTRGSLRVHGLGSRQSGAAESTWGGQRVRNAAAVDGLARWHDAGWVGGAWLAKGDQCPLLWCAWWSSAFCCVCTIWRIGHRKKCDLSGAVAAMDAVAIALRTFPEPYTSVPHAVRPLVRSFSRFNG